MLTDVSLSKESVQSYLTRFELIQQKINKLEPLLKYQTPQFHTPTELRVKKCPISTPFSTVGAIGPATRILGRLQAKESKDLGLVAINTPDRTCIGRFVYFDQNGEVIKSDSGFENSNKVRIEFCLRKVLHKRYNTAICHGSRLICDTDVYNKNYQLQQNLAEIPNFVQQVHTLCSYDKEYLFAGVIGYHVAILKYNHETQLYAVHKLTRLEKAHNIEGNILHIERICHLPQWFACITFRSLRFFKV